MTNATEAAPTGAMTDDEIMRAVLRDHLPHTLKEKIITVEAIRLTRASDRAAMQALADRLIHIAENAASIYDDEPSLSASDMMWGVARDIRAALDALKGVK